MQLMGNETPKYVFFKAASEEQPVREITHNHLYKQICIIPGKFIVEASESL